MKILVVYYSYTGKTENLVSKMKPLLEKGNSLTTIKIEPEKEISYFSKSMNSLFGRTFPIKNEKIENGYDYVLIGFPVWGFSPSVYFNSILKILQFTKGKVILFCSYGGMSADRTLKIAKEKAEKKGFTVAYTEKFKETEDPTELIGNLVKIVQ